MQEQERNESFYENPMKESIAPFDIRGGEVYAPAEDTYLLLKATLKEAQMQDRAIEIGCGSALIARELATKVKNLLATDINPYAVRSAKERGIESLRTDLFRGIRAEFDLIIFNPPYLPTRDDEKSDGWINYALDGGETGREIVYRFLEDLKYHLSPQGRALLLISSLTGLKEVKDKAAAERLEANEIAIGTYFFERLYVLRIKIAGEEV